MSKIIKYIKELKTQMNKPCLAFFWWTLLGNVGHGVSITSFPETGGWLTLPGTLRANNLEVCELGQVFHILFPALQDHKETCLDFPNSAGSNQSWNAWGQGLTGGLGWDGSWTRTATGTACPEAGEGVLSLGAMNTVAWLCFLSYSSLCQGYHTPLS